MTTVYSDQLWVKSNCREFEGNTNLELRQLTSDNSLTTVYLVDACPYDKSVTYVTDNILSWPHIGLYPEFWGGFYYQPTYVPVVPGKLFNCFINRACVFRQSWFYQFIRKQLLDQGNISYLLDYREMPAKCKTKQQLNEWLYHQGNGIFKKEHNYIKNQVPFCNFSGELEQATVNSKVGIVIETYFDTDHAIAFSEKVFRALQLPRPFMLFAVPGAVDVLRKFNFDVYDDIINHDYDCEENSVDRQTMILDQLENFKHINYTSKQLSEFELRAECNRKHLKNLLLDWPKKLESVKSQIGKK